MVRKAMRMGEIIYQESTEGNRKAPRTQVCVTLTINPRGKKKDDRKTENNRKF